jgi:AraC-like DNA-binding protein
VSQNPVEVDFPISDYREFWPPPFLKEHLLCSWTQRIAGSQGSYLHRVLPDACVDIVFINGDAPVVVGPWTECFMADLPAGTTIVGVRFRPGQAATLLGLPVCSLRNQSVALRFISRNSAFDVFSRIADESSLSGKRSAIETGLLKCLGHSSPADRTVSAAIRWLARHPHGRVEQVSESVGISTRQIHRRFLEAVGYGPKMFQSIIRFQYILNLAGQTHNRQSLASLAASAGYADQAHMTREVHRFSGAQPTAVLGSSQCTLGMAGFFVNKSE